MTGAIFMFVQTDEKKKQKVEFYHGSGFLSQSSRKIRIPKAVREIVIYDYAGNARKITPEGYRIAQFFFDFLTFAVGSNGVVCTKKLNSGILALQCLLSCSITYLHLSGELISSV